MFLPSLFLFFFASADAASQWNLVPVDGSSNWKTTLTDGTGQFAIASDNYDVYYSSDYGKTWGMATGVSCFSGCKLFAFSKSGGVIYKLGTNSFQKSLDYGHTFTTFTTAYSFASAVITDPTGQKMMFAEDLTEYRLLISSNYGASFTVTSAPAKKYTALTSDSSMTKIVALSIGYPMPSGGFLNSNELYYSHDSGTTWTLVNQNFNGGTSYSAALTSDPTGKYVVLAGLYDDPVAIFHSSDFGVTWNTATPNSGYWALNNAYNLISSYTGQSVAIACGPGVYLSENYGASWSQDTSAPTTSYLSLAANYNFTVLYLQTSTGIYVRSEAPTAAPTSAPSAPPSVEPTIAPSAPTVTPSLSPSALPSVAPTFHPSSAPTFAPTSAPTGTPSLSPSALPSVAPTFHPSSAPTFAPTNVPTISFQPTVGVNVNSNSQTKLSDGGIAGIVIGCVVFVAVVGVLVYMFVGKSVYHVVRQPDVKQPEVGMQNL